MDVDKEFDNSLDRVIKVFKKIIEKGFDKLWFTWLEWVTIAAALYAVGQKTESTIITLVAIFSGALLFFKAWLGGEKLIIEIAPNVSEKNKPIFFWLIILIIAIFPFGVMLFLGEVFRGLLGE